MIEIQKFKAYRVSGNTFSVKDLLKSAGGTWDKDAKAWTVRVGGMKDLSSQRRALEQAQRAGCTVAEIQ